MRVKVRTSTRVSLNLTPKEAATLVQVLAAASSPESGLRLKIETLYSDLYKSLEDQGFEPMIGRLNLRFPVRQKPAPEDPSGDCQEGTCDCADVPIPAAPPSGVHEDV